MRLFDGWTPRIPSRGRGAILLAGVKGFTNSAAFDGQVRVARLLCASPGQFSEE
jgi:hypothetical protein